MCILFLIKDKNKKNFELGNYNKKKRFIDCAVKTGEKVVISSWNNLVPGENEIIVKRGIVKTESGEQEIENQIRINPYYINLHVNSAIQEDVRITNRYSSYVVENILENSFVSSHRRIRELGKWNMEYLLKKADKKGVKANRPYTLTLPLEEIIDFLKNTFNETPEKTFVAKTHSGTRCKGLYLISKKNYEQQYEEMKKSSDKNFVLQDFVADTVLYKNKKCDLRIYVGVFSWNPLKFKVYRNGLTRISNKDFDINNFEEIERSISTVSLLNGEIEHNLTIDKYLEDSCDYSKEVVWEKIENEIGETLKALSIGGNYSEDASLSKTIYLLGLDIMLVKEGNEVRPCLIEINHFPTLFRSEKGDPEGEVNSLLEKTYTDFFQDIKQHVSSTQNINGYY